MNQIIAIIGGGAAATSYLCSLKTLLTEQGKQASVLIFDQPNALGRGQVYGMDYPWLIMNTPAQDLSACYGASDDFIQWSVAQGIAERGGDYVSRTHFGHYLHARFTEVCDALNVGIIPCRVKDVLATDHGFLLVTENNHQYSANYVVVASRHHSLSDPFHLSKMPGFIAHPYPLMRTLQNVKKNKRVLVMGSGLTGVDCAITLSMDKSPARMVMVSRNGCLPGIKGRKLFSCPPRFFLAQNIATKQTITLRTLLRVARQELTHRGIDWRTCLFTQRECRDSINHFHQQLALAKHSPTEFNLILGMIPELACLWPEMPREQVEVFLNTYYGDIQRKHGAIPLCNAKKIAALLLQGEVALKKGVATIKRKRDEFLVTFGDGSQDRFDYVVNATGIERKIARNAANRLYVNLLNRQLIEELPCGGIRVRYPDATPLVNEKDANPNLFLIGHNGEGTHVFTNNYQWIVETGFRSAQKLVERL